MKKNKTTARSMLRTILWVVIFLWAADFMVSLTQKLTSSITEKKYFDSIKEQEATWFDSRLAQATKWLIHGEPAHAERIFNTLIPQMEAAYGPEHPNTLEAHSRYGQAVLLLHRFSEAESLYTTLIPRLEAAVGHEHPSTLLARLNHTAAVQSLGHDAEAESLYTTLIPRLEATNGLEHPSTLMARSNHAATVLALGRYTKAESLYSALIPRLDAAHGPEHPYTVVARVNHAEAESLVTILGPRVDANNGPLHPDTLEARLNHAVTILNQGNYAKAGLLLTNLTRQLVAAYGPEHTHTLRARLNYAEAALYLGRINDAESLFTALIPQLDATNGPEHEDTLKARMHHATAVLALGRYSDADSLYSVLIPQLDTAIGTEHPYTLVAQTNHAGVILSLGRHAEAESLYKDLIPLLTAANGPDHLDTLMARNGHAAATLSLGNYREAESLYTALIPLLTAANSSQHPNTLTARINHAGATLYLGRYSEAESLLTALIPQLDAAIGAERPTTLVARLNHAWALLSLGRYGEAERLYITLIPQLEAAIGSEHPLTLVARMAHARTLQLLERYVDADQLLSALILHWEAKLVKGSSELKRANLLHLINQVMLGAFVGNPAAYNALRSSLISIESADKRIAALLLSTIALLDQQGDRFPQALSHWHDYESQAIALADQHLGAVHDVLSRLRLASNDVVGIDNIFSLAFSANTPETHAFAANVALRWQGLEALDETRRIDLFRSRKDPEAKANWEALKKADTKVSGLSFQLGSLGPTRPDFDATHSELTEKLRGAKRKRNALSRQFSERLDRLSVNSESVRATLDEGEALLLLRPFERIVGKTPLKTETHLLMLLLQPGTDAVVLQDLGPEKALWGKLQESATVGTPVLLEWLLGSGTGADSALAALSSAERVFISAAGRWTTLPFASLTVPEAWRPEDEASEPETGLKNAAPWFWMERHELVLLPAPGYLLRKKPGDDNGQLVALGLNFDPTEAVAETEPDWSLMVADAVTEPPSAGLLLTGSMRSAACVGSQVQDQKPLKHAETEALELTERFGKRFSGSTVLTGTEASEERLTEVLSKKGAPRLLHIASHALFLGSCEERNNNREDLMAQSVLFLANANETLKAVRRQQPVKAFDEQQDGLLFAAEVQHMNLAGTELVVLSACQTANGITDQSDGLLGLSRGLATAGSRFQLLTLVDVNDLRARRFIDLFMNQWLNQPEGNSDPVAAFRQAQMVAANNFERYDGVWESFVLIQTGGKASSGKKAHSVKQATVNFD